MASPDFSFSTFSKNAFYGELNARLVDMTDVAGGQRIVDLACGTGGVTRLILERIKDARDSVIIAMDQSAAALKQAMEDLKDIRDNAVQFVHSRVEQVSESLKEKADTVILCNAIHYISDKDGLLTEISKALKPGGKFAFNTSFYEGGQHPESVLFYRKWMFKAARTLRREFGLSPDKSAKVESRKDLVEVPIEGWLDICGFEDFIAGIMPGVPLAKASESLRQGVYQAFEELDLQFVPRNWLDIVAVRA